VHSRAWINWVLQLAARHACQSGQYLPHPGSGSFAGDEVLQEERDISKTSSLSSCNVTPAVAGMLGVSRRCSPTGCHGTNLQQGRCLAKAHSTHEHREEHSKHTATCNIKHRQSTPIRNQYVAVKKDDPSIQAVSLRT
jgi:hypothetical protein